MCNCFFKKNKWSCVKYTKRLKFLGQESAIKVLKKCTGILIQFHFVQKCNFLWPCMGKKCSWSKIEKHPTTSLDSVANQSFLPFCVVLHYNNNSWCQRTSGQKQRENMQHTLHKSVKTPPGSQRIPSCFMYLSSYISFFSFHHSSSPHSNKKKHVVPSGHHQRFVESRLPISAQPPQAKRSENGNRLLFKEFNSEEEKNCSKNRK